MKILAIEDDTDKTDLFEILLECFPYKIIKINTNEDWLQMVLQINPDLVILDMFTPETTDFSICEQLRKIVSVPILIISVIDSPELIAKALNAGADDVMTKPISRSLLIARVNGFFIRSGGGRNLLDHNISLTYH